MADFSGRLSNAPVVYALCQIRFSPVLKMGDMVADIQELLRATYEGFEEEQLAGIKIEQRNTSVLSETRWRFETANRRSGYVLTNASIVYHTTDYLDFDAFVPEVVRGFSAVSSVAKIQRVSRIGVRYVDLIEGDANHRADSFLHDRLRGFSSELPFASDPVNQFLYTGKTDAGRLVLRVTLGKHEVALPPDLMPIALESIRKPDKAQMSVFLDTDHFTEGPESSIAISDVEGTVRKLKVAISATFKNAITQEAVNTWK